MLAGFFEGLARVRKQKGGRKKERKGGKAEEKKNRGEEKGRWRPITGERVSRNRLKRI